MSSPTANADWFISETDNGTAASTSSSTLPPRTLPHSLASILSTADVTTASIPYHHQPISYSSAFSARSNSRANSVATSSSAAYPNEFGSASAEAIFPFGDPSVARGGESGRGGGAFGFRAGEATGANGGTLSEAYAAPTRGQDGPFDASLLQRAAAAALGSVAGPSTSTSTAPGTSHPSLDIDTGLDASLHFTAPGSPATPLAKGSKKGKKRAPYKPRATKPGARQSRSISVVSGDAGNDDDEGAKPKRGRPPPGRNRIGTVLALTTKTKRAKLRPAQVIKSGDVEAIRSEIQRATDPCVHPVLVLSFVADNSHMSRSMSATLTATIASHRDIYQTAYNALNDELIKIQIEESVLRNLKSTVFVSLHSFIDRSGH